MSFFREVQQSKPNDDLMSILTEEHFVDICRKGDPPLVTHKRFLTRDEYQRLVTKKEAAPFGMAMMDEELARRYITEHPMTKMLADKGIHDPVFDDRFVVVVSHDFPV